MAFMTASPKILNKNLLTVFPLSHVFCGNQKCATYCMRWIEIRLKHAGVLIGQKYGDG